MTKLELAIETDAEILNLYANGDKSGAANRLARKYQSFVFSTAYRRLNSYDDAEDIAQEVFIKAYNAIGSFRGESSLKTWLYRITVNLCSNFQRKRKLLSFFSKRDDEEGPEEPFDLVIKEEETPESTFEKSEFEKLFVQAVKELPEKQRETFMLRYYEEMSYEEISKALGGSVGGLKANYFHAVRKLSKKLKANVE